MILQLGINPEVIRVTAEYSNAVLVALLPYFSDFSQKLDLPVPHPITVQDVAHCAIPPFQKDGGIASCSIMLKNGWSLGFEFGHVNGFESPRSYHSLQNPDEIPKFYGQVKMTTNEAVQLARNTIKKLSIPLEDVFADQEPKITPPVHIDSNTVPRYMVEWFSPRSGIVGAVRVEVNAENKHVERLSFHCENLFKPAPKVNVIPPKGHAMFDSFIPPPPNPEYAQQLVPIMFKAIDEYGQKLSLPIPRPLTTNNVALVRVEDNGGWPHCEIKLTNGWRFIYRHCMVNGYYAPTTLFDNQHRHFHLKDFEGKWNLNTNQAFALVKNTLAKLNYPTNNIHLDFAPEILYAAEDFKKTIPRYFFEWYYKNATGDDLQSKVEAEVNADNGKLESLYYDDKAYWGCRPPIDVPISSAATNKTKP